MGHIIRLPVSPAGYPDSSARLDPAERTLLVAIRSWVAAYRCGNDPVPLLSYRLECAGARDAAVPIDMFMAIVAGTLREPIVIHCADCTRLSCDEKHVLHSASLAQAGDADLAEKALRNALLSAQGAEFAAGPLEGLATLFAEAKLLFRRRRSPGGDYVPSAVVQAWSPSMPPGAVH
jgi:hypothetical protein